MIRRALAADVPFSWVAADAVYGLGDVEGAVRQACTGYFLGVKSDHYFGSWAKNPAQTLMQDSCRQRIDLTYIHTNWCLIL